MRHLFILPLLLLLASLPASAEPGGPAALFDHTMRRLHSPETVDLRASYAGQPLLIVNTASHCGFTDQFGDLETIHQTYRERGLKVIGFPSNDFRQEADDEADTARVCFVNFGVSFDMFAPIHVRGDDAHPIFRELARQSSAPRWNFHKYVVDREGRVVGAFPARTSPTSREVREAIESVL
ncbi:glutathione peroxidase [Pseudothauera nasutitermitis]|uniref:Glutathione peroxidase n=1 Tax=Pseudothauera nasutitermitis TaxID=2565930 RepID=A0A4S4B3I8_9RHOO|nr:glutathione peroxidase [Pseudothauera nasutitermitis]THF66300.1 glutathione peroxidase [Pseudothauera nasutitermitis]